VESLSSVLPRVFKQLGLEEGLLGWRAVHEWEQAVGPRIARHTRAVAFREGVLQVEVEGSAWMHELGFLKVDLMRKINRHLGSRLVRNVRFVLPRGGILR
jgi:predicted nucleic acid-binding Zn ribbon protein